MRPRLYARGRSHPLSNRVRGSQGLPLPGLPWADETSQPSQCPALADTVLRSSLVYYLIYSLTITCRCYLLSTLDDEK